jgi:hypothetical protein
MPAESNLSIAGDADRGGPEAAHRDSCFVQGGHARQDGRA